MAHTFEGVRSSVQSYQKVVFNVRQIDQSPFPASQYRTSIIPLCDSSQMLGHRIWVLERFVEDKKL
ncbi:hypothetical protein WG66_008428 [Moniliophthora roreri]|nr:hypothetical protein WG66_008428 [Moniliophthora roreri]